MENTVVITGTLKNIKAYSGTRGTLVTGWLNQRDVSRLSDDTMDRAVYVAGINIVGLDTNVVKTLTSLDNARQGSPETTLVTLRGRLVTHFDRRPSVAEADRNAPRLQLEVFEVAVD
jgi:hypothetical protein